MARAAGVDGAVVVEVVVGERGRVIMARAISGHPLLRDAAVKVIGTITFNFRKGTERVRAAFNSLRPVATSGKS